jgi:predicted ester cyclase
MAQTTDAQTLVERMFDQVINKGDYDAIEELYAPDFVAHGPMGDVKGREAFTEMIAAWRDAAPDVHCEVSNFVVNGDEVAWLVRATGTHTGDGLGFPATGRPFDTLNANIGILRDGQAVEHWSDQGMFQFLVQVGMIPLPGA